MRHARNRFLGVAAIATWLFAEVACTQILGLESHSLETSVANDASVRSETGSADAYVAREDAAADAPMAESDATSSPDVANGHDASDAGKSDSSAALDASLDSPDTNAPDAGPGASIYGNGADGVFTAAAGGATTINANALVTDTSVAANATSFHTVITSDFNAGDEIFILQVQDGSAIANAGNWEFATIASINASSPSASLFTLTTPLKNAYVSGTFNAASSMTTEVVRVPHYTTAVVPLGSTLTAPSWNGVSGGVVALRAASLDVEGAIDLTGAGFRGGIPASNLFVNATELTANQGESPIGVGEASTSANGGGGGGGASEGCSGATGGAGAYATQLSDNGTDASLPDGGKSDILGENGRAYGDVQLAHIYFGAGGGGAAHTCGAAVHPGTAGGGIVFIFANTLTVGASGSILAQGSVHAVDDPDGGIGYTAAGAGGSIWLTANTMSIGTGQVSAVSGSGPNIITGGDGFVRLDAIERQGTSTPMAYLGIP
jgi:hypothetical protein